MDKQIGLQRKIESYTVESHILDESRVLKVFVPPEYSAQKKYPILYCHDGLEFFTHGRIATIANQMIAEGFVQPLLIAGIAVSKTRRNDDYAMNGSRHDAYCRFVVEECLPFLDETYAVNANQRFMMGISLGAVVTLSLSLRYPQLFSRLALLSGAYFPSVQNILEQRDALHQVACYMVVGEQETAVDTSTGIFNFYEYNQQTRDLLRAKGVSVQYGEAPGTHVWGFWQRQIPDVLRWCHQMM